MTDRPLLPRQEAFCRHYVECPCGAEAARRAGYSPASARWTARALLRRADVRARIAALGVRIRSDRAALRARLIGHLEAARAMAAAQGRPGTVVYATRLIERISGASAAAGGGAPDPLADAAAAGLVAEAELAAARREIAAIERQLAGAPARRPRRPGYGARAPGPDRGAHPTSAPRRPDTNPTPDPTSGRREPDTDPTNAPG